MDDVTCGCGCGGKPICGRFLKGHNARLRGRKSFPHGEMGRYRQGCRCAECVDANRLTKVGQRRRRGVLSHAEAKERRRLIREALPPKPPKPTPADRFADGYTVQPDGCWIWHKATNHGGYGVTWDGAKTLVAHRFAYLLHVGPIPEGLHLDHLCRVRACVNPDHLEPVTQAENNRRSWAARK